MNKTTYFYTFKLVIILTLMLRFIIIYPYDSVREIKEQSKAIIIKFISGILKLKNYELTMEPTDQTKILAFIFKTIATPIGQLTNTPTLTRFENAHSDF